MSLKSLITEQEKILRVNLLIIISLLILIIYTKSAADKYANSYLDLSLSPGVCGQGNTGTLRGLDFFSSFYNPALVNGLGNGVTFAHGDYFHGLLKLDAIGVNWNFEKEGVSIIIMRAAVDKIPDTKKAFIDYNENGILDPGEFDPSRVTYFSNEDYALIVGYGGLWKNIEYGMNGKLLYRKLYNENGYGIGLDFGVRYCRGSFIFSGMIKNITTTIISWSTGTKEYSHPVIIFGQSFEKTKDQFKYIMNVEEIIFTEDYDKMAVINQGFIHGTFRLGGILRYDDFLDFRIGFDAYEMNETVNIENFWEEALTMGFGLKMKKVRIDYSLQKKSFLKNTHKVSLSWLL